MRDKTTKIVITIILALIMILYGTVFVTSAVKSQNDYCNHEYKTYETEEFEHNGLEYDYPNFDESGNTEPSYHPQDYFEDENYHDYHYYCTEYYGQEYYNEPEPTLPSPIWLELQTIEKRRQYEAILTTLATLNVLINMVEDLRLTARLIETTAAEARIAYSDSKAEHDEMYRRVRDHDWKFLGYFEITHYCLCIICCGIYSYQHPRNQWDGFVQRTASGTVPEQGRTIATDTNVIPFGTEVVIDGHIFIAEDRGSAVTGNIIDKFVECHEEARRLGRRRNVPIWIKYVSSPSINMQDISHTQILSQ